MAVEVVVEGAIAGAMLVPTVTKAQKIAAISENNWVRWVEVMMMSFIGA